MTSGPFSTFSVLLKNFCMCIYLNVIHVHMYVCMYHTTHGGHNIIWSDQSLVPPYLRWGLFCCSLLSMLGYPARELLGTLPFSLPPIRQSEHWRYRCVLLLLFLVVLFICSFFFYRGYAYLNSDHYTYPMNTFPTQLFSPDIFSCETEYYICQSGLKLLRSRGWSWPYNYYVSTSVGLGLEEFPHHI